MPVKHNVRAILNLDPWEILENSSKYFSESFKNLILADREHQFRPVQYQFRQKLPE